MDDETNKQMGEEVANIRVSLLESFFFCLYACLIIPLKDSQLCCSNLDRSTDNALFADQIVVLTIEGAKGTAIDAMLSKACNGGMA